MIKIGHLFYKVKDKQILEDINLELPKQGLILVSGPSGSGKTTLLNAIAGLIKYEGTITVFNLKISQLSQTDLDEYRLKQLGFIFQDFKLYENDTVINNVLFPLNVRCSSNNVIKKKKASDLLKVVGLTKKVNSYIKKLSGGEKQRVALARALVNDPTIILADEPTGALDETNSSLIMNLLRNFSKDRLVIVVSHDLSLCKNYADRIIELKDGKIINDYYQNIKTPYQTISVMRNSYSNRKSHIPSSFLLRHSYNALTSKKWRTLLCNLVISLGLVGVGLSISLSSSISSNIKAACSSLLSENKIGISLKEKDESFSIESIDYESLLSIEEKYEEDIYGSGVIYKKDFNQAFIDENFFSMKLSGQIYKLPLYSAKHINEFKLIEEFPITIYPNQNVSLENDEIVMSFNLTMVHDICFSLGISRTVETLIEYVKTNSLFTSFHSANREWEYEDEHIFKIKGFVLDSNLSIYHQNPLWNEWVFESEMKLTTNPYIYNQDYYPWTLKKMHYLKCIDPENFLRKIYIDQTLDKYVFELASFQYFPLSYSLEQNVDEIDRIIIFKNKTNIISKSLYKTALEYCSNISNPIYASNRGYLSYPESLLIGFANYTFLSQDYSKINTTMNELSKVDLSLNSFEIDDSILVGHYSKTMQNGLTFETLSSDFDKNYTCLDLDEIVISRSLFNELFPNESFLNQEIYIATSLPANTSTILNDFCINKLKVAGVIESNKLAIYSDVLWPILFYQLKVGISSFDLDIKNLVFNVDDPSNIDSTVSLLKKAFPKYQITNPISNINSSIDETCKYIEIMMLSFSAISIVISAILLVVSDYLHVLENQKDIALARVIGVSKKESNRFIYSHSLLLCLISFIISSLELTIVSYFVYRSLSESLSVKAIFSMNALPYLSMFVLVIFLSLLSSFIVALKQKNDDPLNTLKS